VVVPEEPDEAMAVGSGAMRVGCVASTAEPVPVTAEMAVPFILKVFPVPAVSNSVFVNVFTAAAMKVIIVLRVIFIVDPTPTLTIGNKSPVAGVVSALKALIFSSIFL
jgi:hypothetical protein